MEALSMNTMPIVAELIRQQREMKRKLLSEQRERLAKELGFDFKDTEQLLEEAFAECGKMSSSFARFMRDKSDVDFLVELVVPARKAERLLSLYKVLNSIETLEKEMGIGNDELNDVERIGDSVDAMGNESDGHAQTRPPGCVNDPCAAAGNAGVPRRQPPADQIDAQFTLIREIQHEVGRAFFNACFDGDASLAESFISVGADLEYKINGRTPLWIAGIKGQVSIVQMLIAAGSDVNTSDERGQGVLMGAIMGGYEEIVAALINAGCSTVTFVGHCPFFTAIGLGHAGVVRILLQEGFQITKEHVSNVIVMGHSDVLRVLVDGGMDMAFGEDALLTALMRGQLDCLKILIDANVSIRNEAHLKESVKAAVQAGHVNCITLLLNANILPTEWCVELDLPRIAARNGHLGLLRELIVKGVCDRNCLAELPMSYYIDYRFRSWTEEGRDDTMDLSQACHLDEIADLPGYGNVAKIPNRKSKDVLQFCADVLEDSIDKDKISELKFPLKAMRCGSSAEGTKVGLPNEIDVIFQCLIGLGDINVREVGHGYKIITPRTTGELQNLIHSGSKTFHETTITGITTKEKHDAIRSYQSTTTGGGSASSEWIITCKQDLERSIDVSVDLVPVLKVDGWPWDAIHNSWLMDFDQLRAAGYAFVAKPPSRKSALGKQFFDTDQQRLWRISFSHLETTHMAMVPDRVKDVYITAKSIRNPDVSGVYFLDKDGLKHGADKYLITYLIKMVFMLNVDYFLYRRRVRVDMLFSVYNQLEACLQRWWLPFFWQPHVNVLEGLSLDPEKSKKVAKVMKRHVEAWFVRDGETDSVEQEDLQVGGVYPHLSRGEDHSGDAPVREKEGEKPGTFSDGATPTMAADADSDVDDAFEVVVYRRIAKPQPYLVYNL